MGWVGVSNVCFIFTDGSRFAPDVSVLSKDRARKVGKEKKKEPNFFKTVPEFAIEFISLVERRNSRRQSDCHNRMRCRGL